MLLVRNKPSLGSKFRLVAHSGRGGFAGIVDTANAIDLNVRIHALDVAIVQYFVTTMIKTMT